MNRNQTIAVVVVLVVVLVFLGNLLVKNNAQIITKTSTTESTASVTGLNNNETTKPMNNAQDITPASSESLEIKDVVVGTGAVAKSGDTVTVHYTGKLDDGTVFDSSIPKGQPFSFPLGAHYVIRGWDEGVVGMKVGGKRTLVIKSDYAYGPNGIPGAIPPNATLHFEVEMLKVESK